MNKSSFSFKEDNNGNIISLSSTNDAYKMNWIAEGGCWGKTILPEGAICTVSREIDSNGNLTEAYIFENPTDYDIFFTPDNTGIYTPFNDRYNSAAVSLKQNCHTHIFCGGSFSYVEALRMGGEAPHLGLLLTSGNLISYSIERDYSKSSNDRGLFIMHPAPFSLCAGEKTEIKWKLFWFCDRNEFYSHLSPVRIFFDKYTLFLGESTDIKIEFDSQIESISIGDNANTQIEYCEKGNLITAKYNPDTIGEKIILIKLNQYNISIPVSVILPLEELLNARCSFIAKKQQFIKPQSPLDGAYLCYDNELNSIYYTHLWSDQNGGRERVSMGVLLARYLQYFTSEKIEKSLCKYMDYIYRELFKKNTGEVCNDIRYENRYLRIYNVPWVSVLLLEMFKYTQKKTYLEDMYKSLCYYYSNGGEHFYGIGIPMCEAVLLLQNNGYTEESKVLLEKFTIHCDNIIEQATNYPSHEVNYEQSIVAPAAIYMCEMYLLTKNEKYLTAAKQQIDILSLFNGNQPDFHLNECSIRHWDGYWFGKRKLYGDTFPHYWSILTGYAFELYYKSTNDKNFHQKAINSARCILNLYKANGSAACAYLYPHSVNGNAGKFYEPLANDQDWGLYFATKILLEDDKNEN